MGTPTNIFRSSPRRRDPKRVSQVDSGRGAICGLPIRLGPRLRRENERLFLIVTAPSSCNAGPLISAGGFGGRLDPEAEAPPVSTTRRGRAGSATPRPIRAADPPRPVGGGPWRGWAGAAEAWEGGQREPSPIGLYFSSGDDGAGGELGPNTPGRRGRTAGLVAALGGRRKARPAASRRGRPAAAFGARRPWMVFSMTKARRSVLSRKARKGGSCRSCSPPLGSRCCRGGRLAGARQGAPQRARSRQRTTIAHAGHVDSGPLPRPPRATTPHKPPRSWACSRAV